MAPSIHDQTLVQSQFTISRGTHDKLREAQDLLRHRVPDGGIATVFELALTLLLAALHRTRHAATDRPRATSLVEAALTDFRALGMVVHPGLAAVAARGTPPLRS